jgi:hypothetical protein
MKNQSFISKISHLLKDICLYKQFKILSIILLNIIYNKIFKIQRNDKNLQNFFLN